MVLAMSAAVYRINRGPKEVEEWLQIQKLRHAKEKVTELHFYFHQRLNGENPTAVTEIGRVQGLYAAASLEDVALSGVFKFIFREGEYNGSSLSVLGNNPYRLLVREMPIVGGSGIFRMARGIAKFTTYFREVPSENVPPKYVTVEVNIVAMHC
ncbi:unnamed protein product [Ilex paraguariensis]|uniref:Dirigent protein n=1 Tax=Ilex paraguariensis TaxID=185542 RepID=A0ABC8R9Z3_9AQUA